LFCIARLRIKATLKLNMRSAAVTNMVMA